MSIGLGNSFRNYSNNREGYCTLHDTAVGASYTCDSFEMQADI